jgi:hypothetical protein
MRQIDGVPLFQQDAAQQIRQALLIFHYKYMHSFVSLKLYWKEM